MSGYLPPAAVNRLGQFLALAEAAANPADGERLAALSAVERLLGRYGLRLRDLPRLAAPAPALPEWVSRPRWRDVAAACQRRRESLTDWEAEFLRSLARFGSLTDRQHAVLDRIAARVLGAETEAAA